MDDIIKEHFSKLDELKSNESEQLKKIVEAKSRKRIEKTEEVWANGMKFIKTDEDEKKLRAKELPDLFDYHFEIFRKQSQLKNIEPRKKSYIPYTPPEKKTMNHNRIKLVLR